MVKYKMQYVAPLGGVPDLNYILSAFADEASPNIDGQIKAMKENGVSALEMRGVNGQNVSELSADELHDVVKRIHDVGLSVISIGSPVGKIDITDNFEPHLEKFKRLLEHARAASAKYMRIFSFYGVDSAEKECEVYERLNILASLADGSGVTLCHENEKGIFGWDTASCLKIFENVRGLRGVFDPANFVQCGVETASAWNALVDNIEYLHIKDALPNGRVVPAGNGVGDLECIINEYAKHGGRVFSLEPHLRVFDGFSALEKGENNTIDEDYTYADGPSAFRAAADAAKNIIERAFR